MKIIVIEDNEQNLYLARYLLEARGHQVSDARDGAAGVELATRQPCDAVLLDIQLPRMDGYEVARRLRAVPGLAATPIIAVTSYAMQGDREKAYAAGCTGYMEKPIDPESFAATVEALAAGGAN